DVSDKDVVRYDGRRIDIIEKTIVIMLNKPKKVITTVKDTHNRRIVMDYIPKKFRLTPIGRLDQNTSGLLLFTNDGDLQQFLTHPKNNIPKDYEAIIEGRLSPLQKKKVKKGIYIGFKEFGQAEVLDQVTEKTRSKVTLRLRQGKKREIRRIFFKLKVKLFSLKRIAFSKVKLGDLKEGAYRELQKKEIFLLKKL
ncbi:pseudouridine synthase, partial [Candidatus Marinimicrobia bacterium]|nr:pseudouridine synthase [Candidatus Neomarinimicrobiota bacterium]